MKKYILIKSFQVFYDGHCQPDVGANEVSVEFTDKYNNLDLTGKTEYDEDGEVFSDVDEDGDSIYQANDSYNCEVTSYIYKEITKEQFEEFQEIINKYNSLFKI